jgi:hypothetical protein
MMMDEGLLLAPVVVVGMDSEDQLLLPRGLACNSRTSTLSSSLSGLLLTGRVVDDDIAF